MNTRRLAAPLGAIAVLLLAHCGGGGPTAPSPPPNEGNLFVEDSGCTCGGPFPPIPIFVDGKQAGLCPVLGTLNIPLPPGQHTWTYIPNDPHPLQVTIPLGGTVKVGIQTVDCADGCNDDATARRQQRSDGLPQPAPRHGAD